MSPQGIFKQLARLLWHDLTLKNGGSLHGGGYHRSNLDECYFMSSAIHRFNFMLSSHHHRDPKRKPPLKRCLSLNGIVSPWPQEVRCFLSYAKLLHDSQETSLRVAMFARVPVQRSCPSVSSDPAFHVSPPMGPHHGRTLLPPCSIRPRHRVQALESRPDTFP